MNASFIQRVSLTSALTLVFLGGSANAAAYSWTQIIIPGISPTGNAWGINDRGQVAVNSMDGSKKGIYRSGVFTPLPAPPAGYKITSCLGINNNGVIVGGASTLADPHELGYVLTGSKYTFFSRSGWDNIEPRSIANSGLITGYSYMDSGTMFASFVYDPGTGIFTDVTPPDSDNTRFSTAQGMNAAGRIAGDGRFTTGSGAPRYASVSQLGTLGMGAHTLEPFVARVTIAVSGTVARGINDAGLIVGFTGSGLSFVGSDARGFQRLIPPGGDAAGAAVTCEGINNVGQVVCGVADSSGNPIGEFIGTPDSQDQQGQQGQQ
jgi:hypothetical protein